MGKLAMFIFLEVGILGTVGGLHLFDLWRKRMLKMRWMLWKDMKLMEELCACNLHSNVDLIIRVNILKVVRMIRDVGMTIDLLRVDVDVVGRMIVHDVVLLRQDEDRHRQDVIVVRGVRHIIDAQDHHRIRRVVDNYHKFNLNFCQHIRFNAFHRNGYHLTAMHTGSRYCIRVQNLGLSYLDTCAKNALKELYYVQFTGTGLQLMHDTNCHDVSCAVFQEVDLGSRRDGLVVKGNCNNVDGVFCRGPHLIMDQSVRVSVVHQGLPFGMHLVESCNFSSDLLPIILNPDTDTIFLAKVFGIQMA